MYLRHDDATGAADKEGKPSDMKINRTLAAAIGLLAVGATLIGCSSDKEAGPKASGPGSVTGGGSTVVKVEGQDLAGLGGVAAAAGPGARAGGRPRPR